MANKDELEAMGIFSNRNKLNYSKNNKENTVAKVIKIFAIIEGIVGAIAGFYSIDNLNFDEWGFAIIIVSIVSAVFIFAVGEIIQLLEDIKNK